MFHSLPGSNQSPVSSSDHPTIPMHTMETETIALPFSIPLQSVDGGPVIQPQDSNADVELHDFWKQQYEQVAALTGDELKAHSLPLARIKKIMKSDEDVRMISAEAPILFSKACEIFILELTHRAWNHAEANKRRTVQRTDIAAAVKATDIFDFLVDIVPAEGCEHFMDVQMRDHGPRDHSNGVGGGFPVTQGTILTNPQPGAEFEAVHPDQHRLLSQYLRFNHQ